MCIEQGLAHNNIKAKYDVSCSLRGNFWNAMSMYLSIVLFADQVYLNEFYLPCLKQLVKQDECGNDVVVWFTQMFCCNVCAIIAETVK